MSQRSEIMSDKRDMCGTCPWCNTKEVHVPRLCLVRWRSLVTCSVVEPVKSISSSVPDFLCSLLLNSFETSSLSSYNDTCVAWSHFATEHAEGFSQTELVPWMLLACNRAGALQCWDNKNQAKAPRNYHYSCSTKLCCFAFCVFEVGEERQRQDLMR